jgi:CelD/BcsL family acetyltransferase involved in cellulose biosynthesis
VLSGVDASVLEAARLVQPQVWLRRSLAAPYVDLASLRAAGRDYLQTLGSNTRYQLRRSQRAYAGTGELVLSRASSVAEALAFLDGLAALHQAAWISRGRPGAFAEPWFVRFHQALIERGFDRGEIALLRLAAAGRVVGFLYNYEMRGASLAYQSGFDYASAAHHQRPGLTCHHLAIMDAATRGMDRYDFLAGEDRYKRNLADASAMLHWAELGGAWSARRTTGFPWNWIRAAAGVSTA